MDSAFSKALCESASWMLMPRICAPALRKANTFSVKEQACVVQPGVLVLRIEIDHYPFALVLGQRVGLAVLVHELELRCRLAGYWLGRLAFDRLGCGRCGGWSLGGSRESGKRHGNKSGQQKMHA
ncbi:MAG: hypothetical protein WDO12_06055 [Pseudomonadota bacterium]